MLTLVSRRRACSSCALKTLAVSMGLPMSAGMPSGTFGNVALVRAGRVLHCGVWGRDLGLRSVELWGEWRGPALGRSRALMPGRRAFAWWAGVWVGTEGRWKDSGSCWR